MSVSYLTDTSNPASQPKSIRVYDLYLDGEIIPPLIPGSITPGPDNTFLHTNNLSQVVWQPFSASNITGGNDYDILTKDPIIGWQATQQLQNQNLPDPLIVDEIQANTSVTTTTVQAGIGNIPTINSTSISAVTNVDTGTVNATTLNSQTLSSVNIRDTSLSLGTAGQYLQKSNPGNALVWGSIPIASPNNIAVSLPTAYFFPTTLSNINLNAVFGTSQQYTLASPTINLNNVATEKVHLTFWANVRVSDSATSFFRFSFSVSRCFSLITSFVDIPPYFFFHRYRFFPRRH